MDFHDGLKGPLTAIVNANAVLPDRVSTDAVIFFENGHIVEVGKHIPIPGGVKVIDAEGLYVGPGFVDMHVHGNGQAGNRWEDDPERVAAVHLAHGTTSMNAALGYGHTMESLSETTRLVKDALTRGAMPNVLGIGFEGPYINPHNGAELWKHHFGTPKKEEYETLYDLAGRDVVQWMYAPEMDADGTFAAFLKEHGIPAALGHTSASPDEIRRAVDRGAVIATHLFDAMGCYLGNDSVKITGIIQDTAAVGMLCCNELTYEIIPDQFGVHVKPGNMKMVYQLVGPDRIAIITDCTQRDYDPADYNEKELRSDVDINYNERGEVSGSCMTMDRAVRNFRKHTSADLVSLFKMASLTPARVLGRDLNIGSIEPFKYADFVFMDEDLRLRKVIFRGKELAIS